VVEEFLEVAARSYVWYERFREKLHLDPLPFAYDYLTRGCRVTHERLAERSPKFVAAYDAYMAEPIQPPVELGMSETARRALEHEAQRREAPRQDAQDTGASGASGSSGASGRSSG
jgi:hypothetical protein